VPAYRLYFLDGAGRVESANWVEADGDSAAAETARQLLDKGVYGELWLGQRFVTRLDHEGATSGDAG
jgi:hypothetical protein